MKKYLIILPFFIFINKIFTQDQVIIISDCSDSIGIHMVDILINEKLYTTGSNGMVIFNYIKLPWNIKLNYENNFLLDTVIYSADKVLKICLPLSSKIDEVIVQARKTVEIAPSMISVTKNYIESASYVLGERDAIKSLQYLPGISQGQEGSANFYVRGGGAGENLIILDDVPLNLSPHVFGLISNISTDIVKNVDVYKGGFPAEYGNKTSSVVDIVTINPLDLDNGLRQSTVSLGTVVGSYSSVKKSKSGNFGSVISGRSSLLSLMKEGYDQQKNSQNMETKNSPDSRLNNYFFDLYGKFSYKFSNKWKSDLSIGTFSDQILSYKKGEKSTNFQTGYDLFIETKNIWSNQFAAIKLECLVNPKLKYIFYGNASSQRFKANNFSFTSTIFSTMFDQYNNNINSFKSGMKIQYFINNNLKIYNGLTHEQSNFYNRDSLFRLGQGKVRNYSAIAPHIAFYSMIKGDLFKNRINVNSGIRLVSYYNIKNNIILEPRLNISFKIKKPLLLFATLSRISQQNQVLTRESVGIPYQIWLPGSNAVRPSLSDQVSLGLQYNKNKIKINLELFIKRTKNLVLPSLGSTIFVVDPTGVETLKNGMNRAKGAELYCEYDYNKNNQLRVV